MSASDQSPPNPDGPQAVFRLAAVQLWSVVAIGFLVRLLVAYNTQVVNPDGCIYIHQARALYFGLYDQLTACADRYFSNYPIFISLVYPLVGDWVTAARTVSVLFGTASLIPIYLLVRRYFDDRLTGLITLTFAVLPTMVVRSADAVRGPVYWFFLCLGVYLVVAALDTRRRWYLPLAGLALIMATWGRIEGAIVIPISVVYLLIDKRRGRLVNSLLLLSPVLAAAAISGVAMLYNQSVSDVFRIHEALERMNVPLWQYERMRGVMADLAAHPDDPTMGEFLDKARNMIWLIAAGTLIRFLAEAFYYPFFLVSLLGLAGMTRRLADDRKWAYLALLAAASVLLFYVLLIESWVMERRYLLLVIIPAFIFYGAGLERIIRFFTNRAKMKESLVYLLIGLAIMGLTVPKYFYPREEDKVIFKEIGRLVAQREKSDRVVRVASISPAAARWSSFYANLNYPGAPCPENQIDTFYFPPRDRADLLKRISDKKAKYFIWVERYWPATAYDYAKDGLGPDWVELGRFTHPDSGLMILYQAK